MHKKRDELGSRSFHGKNPGIWPHHLRTLHHQQHGHCHHHQQGTSPTGGRHWRLGRQLCRFRLQGFSKVPCPVPCSVPCPVPCPLTGLLLSVGTICIIISSRWLVGDGRSGWHGCQHRFDSTLTSVSWGQTERRQTERRRRRRRERERVIDAVRNDLWGDEVLALASLAALGSMKSNANGWRLNSAGGEVNITLSLHAASGNTGPCMDALLRSS